MVQHARVKAAKVPKLKVCLKHEQVAVFDPVTSSENSSGLPP